MSGMNPAHHKVTNFTELLKDLPTDAADKELSPPQWNLNGLSPDPDIPRTVHISPLPQLLREAGYFTVHVGKAHFATAGTPGVNPYNLGSIVNISGNMAGMPRSYYAEENFGNTTEKFTHHAVQDMAEYYGTNTFLTEDLTLEALKTLDYPIKEKKPFFLYMSHYAVHGPIETDVRFFQKYLDAGLDTGQARYSAMIEGMDKSLGDIMAYLKRNNVDDNTVIFFMSDNGGQATTLAKGGKRLTQNLPLRSGKGSVYEGGIREPMIVKWPGVIKSGSITDQQVIIEDFYPSILEIAQIKNRKTVQQIDGISFVQTLKGQKNMNSDRSLIWHYPHKWNKADYPGINYFSAIRQGDWKLIYDMKAKALELYNLKNDIAEGSDLAGKYPERVKTMAKALGEKLRNYQAQMPVYKATGKPVLWPDQL
jgi:arylsulfatase A-like enzyme